MLNIGVIGYGYWGPNIVRNFNSIDSCKGCSALRHEGGYGDQGNKTISSD